MTHSLHHLDQILYTYICIKIQEKNVYWHFRIKGYLGIVLHTLMNTNMNHLEKTLLKNVTPISVETELFYIDKT